MLYFKTVCK